MADVYRGVDRVLGRQVAVKVLRETADDESDRARFVIEARTLARLSHPGLVTVLDAGIGLRADDAGPDTAPMSVDQPFLVMELVDGPTLAQVLADGALEPAELQSIGARLAEALAYVHSQGVVHRDVKPANVLLDCERSVKLTDFGIVRLLGDSARHTRTNQMIGTAAYLAPEQVTGQPVTPATDVYSLGLLLLEASTGERVYPGTALESALARLHQAPRIPGTLPPAWRELLGRMTAIDPGARPSAAEVAERLSAGTVAPASVASGAVFDPPTAPLPVSAGRTREPVAWASSASPAADGAGRHRRGAPPRWLALAAPAALAAAVAAVVVASPLVADAGSSAESSATQEPVAEVPARDAAPQDPSPTPDDGDVALTSESSSQSDENRDAPVGDTEPDEARVIDYPTGTDAGNSASAEQGTGDDEKKPAEKVDDTKADRKKPADTKADDAKADQKKPADTKTDQKQPADTKADEPAEDATTDGTDAGGAEGDVAGSGGGSGTSNASGSGNGSGNGASGIGASGNGASSRG
jgi:tRNA A-37 threonylcarbamoyl transferase component Bud32